MATKTKSISPKRAPKLPEKLSDCLAVALGDLIKCERQKRKYRIDMDTYHKPNSHCTVCLAGAAMVGLGVSDSADVNPGHFSDHNYKRLQAISDVAIGDRMRWACWDFVDGGDVPASLREQVVAAPYSAGPAQFKSQIRHIIKELRKHGL